MKLFIQSIKQMIFWTILTGVIYPLVITGIAQVAFPRQANGSLIESGGKISEEELLEKVCNCETCTNIKYWSKDERRERRLDDDCGLITLNKKFVEIKS